MSECFTERDHTHLCGRPVSRLSGAQRHAEAAAVAQRATAAVPWSLLLQFAAAEAEEAAGGAALARQRRAPPRFALLSSETPLCVLNFTPSVHPGSRP